MIGSETYGGNLVNNVKLFTLKDNTITLKNSGKRTNFNWGLAGTLIIEHYMYVAGGSKLMAGTTTALTQAAGRYDVKTDTWSNLPNTLYSHPAGPSLFVFSNRLYVVGGNPSQMKMESISLASPQQGWRDESVVPPYNLEMATAVLLLHGSTNYVFIPAGVAAIATTGSMLQWSPGYPQWWRTTMMNIKRGLQHCTVSDGSDSIWVMAGCTSTTCGSAFVEKFSPSTATWTAINAKPTITVTNYQAESCTYWNGYIFATFVTTNPTDSLHVFNTKTNTWKALPKISFTPNTYRMSGVVPMANL